MESQLVMKKLRKLKCLKIPFFLSVLLCSNSLYADIEASAYTNAPTHYTGIADYTELGTGNIDTYKEVNYNFTQLTDKPGYGKNFCKASLPVSLVFTQASLFDTHKQKWSNHSPENKSWRSKSINVLQTRINSNSIMTSGSFFNRFNFSHKTFKMVYNFSEVSDKKNQTIKGVIWNKYCKISYQKILLSRRIANKQ